MNASGPQPRRAALAFIFITVLLDMLALGMVIPVLPRLIMDFHGGDTAAAARTVGLFGTAWALMQFVFSPVLGALSDRFGRRPVVLTSNFGLGFDYILMALAPTVGWLFAGRVISGITSASIPTAYAYIADVTPPEKRAQGFGMLGAAFGLGFIAGPAVGGLLGYIDPRMPFWVAGALSLANAAYGTFVLPESLPPERRSAFSWKRANPVGAVRLLLSYRSLFGLSAVNFLYYLAHEVLPATFVLYTTYRFGWSEWSTGLALAVTGVCSATVQAGLIRPLVSHLGERNAVLLALSSGATGFLVLGSAPTAFIFMLGIPLISMLGVSAPAIQGLMTRRVAADEQGKLQGAQSSLRGMSGLVGPGLFTTAFASFIGGMSGWHIPGAAFLLAGMLVFAALVLATFVTRETT